MSSTIFPKGAIERLAELAKGATEGPWLVDFVSGIGATVRACTGRRICTTFVQQQPKTRRGFDSQCAENNANSEYIAACNPAAIQQCAAEFAAMRERAEAAERREEGLRESLEDMLLHYGFDVDIECRKKPDDELEVIQSAREVLAQSQEVGK